MSILNTYLFQPIQSPHWRASIAAAVFCGAVHNLLHTQLLKLVAFYSMDRLYGANHAECPTTPTLQWSNSGSQFYQQRTMDTSVLAGYFFHWILIFVSTWFCCNSMFKIYPFLYNL